MKLTTKTTKMLLIENIMKPPYRLDPIRVITENFEPGQGRIIITCYDTAWVAYWGAMGNKRVEEFFVSCNPEYLADNLIRSSRMCQNKHAYAYLVRIAQAVQEALRKSMPRMTTAKQQRLVRLEHANSLIRVISQHGRRFFWNESAQRVARLDLDHRGKIWWVDDYRGRRVCAEKIGGYEHRWQGFSHGGTLKQLAQMMRDYIKTGERIHWGYIAPDCWGYDDGASKDTRDAAAKLPIIKS